MGAAIITHSVAIRALVAVVPRSGSRALIDTALARRGIQLDWTYVVTHISLSLGLVEAGLGIAVLPRLAAPAARCDSGAALAARSAKPKP